MNDRITKCTYLSISRIIGLLGSEYKGNFIAVSGYSTDLADAVPYKVINLSPSAYFGHGVDSTLLSHDDRAIMEDFKIFTARPCLTDYFFQACGWIVAL